MQTIKCHVNQISKDLILEDGDIKIQLCSPAGGHVLAVSAERSYWDDDLGDVVIEQVDVREALLENQYGFWLDHALYTDQNKWFLYGRARYQSFPLFYYGIGRDSPEEVQSVIDGRWCLFEVFDGCRHAHPKSVDPHEAG